MSTADLYDLTIAIILIIFAIRGYQKGLVNQLGALISMIAGVFVSVRFTPALAPHLWGSDNIRYVCAFVILILAATLIIWGIVNAISAAIANLKLNSWNNQMGALLGVVYGVLWAIALTFALLIFAVPGAESAVDENGNPVASNTSNEPSFVMASKTGPYLTNLSFLIINHLPQSGDCKFYTDLCEYLQRNVNGIKKNIPELTPEQLLLSTSGEAVQDDDQPRLRPALPLPEK